MTKFEKRCMFKACRAVQKLPTLGQKLIDVICRNIIADFIVKDSLVDELKVECLIIELNQ